MNVSIYLDQRLRKVPMQFSDLGTTTVRGTERHSALVL